MGLMQSAYETFEVMAPSEAGVYDEKMKEVFAPVSHLVTSAGVEITIDLEGNFISARVVDKKEPKIIIPVTEKSAGRSGTKPKAHPLCEQIGYLCGHDAEKLSQYLRQLEQWRESRHTHPTVDAVYAYVKKRTILSDLERIGLVKYDEKGKLKDEKALVRWRVQGCDVPECWENKALFDAFIRYYEEVHSNDCNDFCMITGKFSRPADQHPKGIVALNGNAKMISSNDKQGFTYRGRFTTDAQALSVSYEASQKAHAALRWLITNQGLIFGGRTFLCWSPQGADISSPANSIFRRYTEPIIQPSDYRDSLRKTLRGWKTCLPRNAKAVIAAFDAATKGRLALTYYNELQASDFLERLCVWDEACCWWNGRFGIQSPALFNIATFAFGSYREKEGSEGWFEADDKLIGQQMQRLIACRVDQAALPSDVVRSLVIRCERLYLYTNGTREKLLFTTCAALRKHYIDRNKGEWKLALERTKPDASYQFGRLLAVMEKAERDTYEADEKREPNAMRVQPFFVRKPMSATMTILEQLKNAYYPKLKPITRAFYEQLIEEIMAVISDCSEKDIKGPLKEAYLMGYYLQKKELYTSRDDRKENEDERFEEQD